MLQRFFVILVSSTVVLAQDPNGPHRGDRSEGEFFIVVQNRERRLAVVTGEGLTSATLDDGRTLSRRFAQSVVLVLTDGDWKVFHAHRSFPPA